MENPFRQYFNALPCYVTVQDRDLRIIEANQRFLEDFGTYKGKHCYHIYKRRSEKCEGCPVEQTFWDGNGHRSEERVTCLDGKEVLRVSDERVSCGGAGYVVENGVAGFRETSITAVREG